jgi:2'-5' RNA ligase
VTVARVPRPREVGAIVDALGEEPVGPPWPVDDVVLVASDTRSTGARYSEVARVPLARMGE